MTPADRVRHAASIVLLGAMFSSLPGCGGGSATPSSPTMPTVNSIDQALVTQALDYWRSILAIDYTVIDADTPFRILIRAGTDGLGPTSLARGLIDGTDSGNWATSGLIVVRPGVTSAATYRHEFGHALGFNGHSDSGLMAPTVTADVLSDRERQMMLALYSIPAGTSVAMDGSYTTPEGVVGRMTAAQAADIIAYNITALGGSSSRRTDVTTRWRTPVRVFIQR